MRETDFLQGAVAHAAGQFAKGFMGHETDVATAAENLHNTYAQLSVERQRRFWVRFF